MPLIALFLFPSGSLKQRPSGSACQRSLPLSSNCHSSVQQLRCYKTISFQELTRVSIRRSCKCRQIVPHQRTPLHQKLGQEQLKTRCNQNTQLLPIKPPRPKILSRRRSRLRKQGSTRMGPTIHDLCHTPRNTPPHVRPHKCIPWT